MTGLDCHSQLMSKFIFISCYSGFMDISKAANYCGLVNSWTGE